MTKCPECGCEMNESLGFCTACGRLCSNTATVPAYMQTNRTVDRSKNKTFSIVAVAILITSLFAGLVIVGGAVDFEGRDNGDGYLLTNTSIGVFERIEWEVTDVEGTTTHIGTGGQILWPIPEAGVYKITMHAFSLYGLEQSITKEMVQGTEKAVYRKWTFGTTSYTVDVKVQIDDYMKYRNDPIERWPGESADAALVRAYMNVASSNAVFEAIADQLINQFPAGATKEYRTNAIMSYVQQFEYKSDETKGAEEYWKFPMETIFEGGGDCEDLAIMCMTLFELVFTEQGEEVNVALALYWGHGDVGGHAMASIALDNAPLNINQKVENGYIKSGKTYYVAETTSKGWTVGRMSNNYIDYNLNTKAGMLIRPAAPA